MKHTHVSLGQDADAQLSAISERFDQHAAELHRHYTNSSCTPWEEQVNEICLDAVGAALIEAAIEIRHQTPAGRAAKERMLAHIDKRSDDDAVPYSQDTNSLGGRLAASLTRSASLGN